VRTQSTTEDTFTGPTPKAPTPPDGQRTTAPIEIPLKKKDQ